MLGDSIERTEEYGGIPIYLQYQRPYHLPYKQLNREVLRSIEHS